jgi:hypothetical protein
MNSYVEAVLSVYFSIIEVKQYPLSIHEQEILRKMLELYAPILEQIDE